MLRSDQIKNFFSLIEKQKELITITSHKSADVDAIGAAIGLKYLISMVAPNCLVEIVSHSLSSKVLNFCSYIGCLEEIKIDSVISSNTSLVVLVDTNSLELTGITNITEFPIAIIDHHFYNEEDRNKENKKESNLKAVLVEENISSASELVTKIIQEYCIKIEELPEKIAWVMLGGIIGDTNRFTYANKDTFSIVSSLMVGNKFSYDKLLEQFSYQIDSSERNARLKAAQRMKIHKIKNIIIVCSRISAFEASTARSFVYMGADLAIVGSLKKDETRISIRSSTKFTKLGFHVGKDIAYKIGNKIKNGSGSGHPSVGGINAKHSLTEKEFYDIINEFIAQIEKKIIKMKEEIT